MERKKMHGTNNIKFNKFIPIIFCFPVNEH